jgi:hypothetical protein
MKKTILKKSIAGLIFGVCVATGIALTQAFREPDASPASFHEPTNQNSQGDWAGYGRGWQKNSSGDGSTEITKAVCDADSNWKWFEDGNGDGDYVDQEDGFCVRTATVTSDSWNGAKQVTPNNLPNTTANSGSANSITKNSAGWTADNYKNHIVKIISGTANTCWGKVKTNTSDTITVYGSWLSITYTGSCGIPDGSSHFQVFDDWGLFDNSWIGDYTCTGNFPSGSVVHHSYPSSGTIALETADCYDGKRDLLPNEIDRAVISGTASSASSTSLTDSSKSLDTNVWIGQKLLITGGTGSGSYGIIESNTANQITVSSWSGTEPTNGSTYSIIYIVPHAAYVSDALLDGDGSDAKANNGPLNNEILKNWKGTRLPTPNDFIGYCGYKDGGSNYENTTGTYSADKTYGNYGGQVGRTDEFMDLANTSYEWLSEQYIIYNALSAGGYACSGVDSNSVYYGYRFRAVFRP